MGGDEWGAGGCWGYQDMQYVSQIRLWKYPARVYLDGTAEETGQGKQSVIIME